MSEQQQAAEAVAQWVEVVRWLGEVEGAVSNAPVVGAIDREQVDEASETVRAARLAVSALVGEYFTVAQDSQQPAQQQPSQQQWTQRGPISAMRPGDQLEQQPGSPQQAAQPTSTHSVGWQ